MLLRRRPPEKAPSFCRRLAPITQPALVPSPSPAPNSTSSSPIFSVWFSGARGREATWALPGGDMMVVARDRGGLAAFGVIEESGEAGQGRLAFRARGGRMGGSPTLVQPVLHRAYFLDDHLGASINHLRFLGRKLITGNGGMLCKKSRGF